MLTSAASPISPNGHDPHFGNSTSQTLANILFNVHPHSHRVTNGNVEEGIPDNKSAEPGRFGNSKFNTSRDGSYRRPELHERSGGSVFLSMTDRKRTKIPYGTCVLD